MADFRRVVTALAVVVLLMGFAQTASAQSFSCNASAVPTILRSEGITELSGDILLTCSGTVPSPGFANFQVFYTTGVTSRLMGDRSESLLLINNPVAGSSDFVLGTTAFQGQVIGNSVAFVGVPIVPAATAGTFTQYRITNVRVNASAVGAGLGGAPGSVLGLVSIAGPFAIPVNNPQQVVGFVQAGLSFQLRNDANGDPIGASGLGRAQCAQLSNSRLATLRFSEGFPTAFKIRELATGQTQPGVAYNTESGLVVTSISATPTTGGTVFTAGRADFGTRLRAVFTNVPAGVTIQVSTRNVVGATAAPVVGTDPEAVLVSSADGAFSQVTNTATRETIVPTVVIPVTGGTAVAVWEVTAVKETAVENLDFAVYVSTSPNVGQNLPAAGVQSSVAGTFAPISANFLASATAPIPRFIDSGVARNFLNFTICRTILLFPFVTNQAGFDTGLAISNTSQDPLGTSAQAGTCTWNFFGANAPAAVTTDSVAAGTTVTTLASTSAQNFQGYAIAICNFQFAHGFAFVSDLGARNLAMGYLSLVIPDRGRVANSADLGAAAGQGEQLSN